MALTMNPQELTDGEKWLKYSNQSATRNQPLSPKLVESMSFLKGMGVQMNVVSGGQDHKGHGHRRTGSTRHDGGNAADADFYYQGRKLLPSNPADRQILSQIVSRASANGVTGFGEGDDYMGSGRIHLGYGAPAVWGAGGKSANAPDWLREATGGAHYHGDGHDHGQNPQATTGGQQAPDAAMVPQDAFMAALQRITAQQQGPQGQAQQASQPLTMQDRLSGVGSALMSLDRGAPITPPQMGQGGQIDLSSILDKVRTSPIFNQFKGLSL